MALQSAAVLAQTADALRRLTRLSGPQRRALARQLAAMGWTTRQIAAHVGVCERTDEVLRGGPVAASQAFCRPGRSAGNLWWGAALIVRGGEPPPGPPGRYAVRQHPTRLGVPVVEVRWVPYPGQPTVAGARALAPDRVPLLAEALDAYLGGGVTPST